MNQKFENHYLKKGVKNLTILPPSIDLDQNNYGTNSHTQASEMQLSKKNLRIVFTGSVYAAHESAVIAFLKAAEKVDDIEVSFATPSQNEYLKDVSIGFLQKSECLLLQRSADVLFLPLSPDSPYPEEVKYAFPCKVLEYLAAAKPILAVVPKDSFMEDFIKSHEVGVVVTGLSAVKIADAIEELKDEERRKRFSENALRTVKLFDARMQSKKLFSLLNSIALNYRTSLIHVANREFAEENGVVSS
jgi:glycosyltransferase involved in cell wall biosynthesis